MISRLAAAAVCWLASAGAGRAPGPPPKVEQGVGDVGPGSVSTRQLGVDLRRPTGFGSVFEVQRTDPFSAPGERTQPFFMRSDGAVTAVFPRSVYMPSAGKGLLPHIPPNTVFYIGKLPSAFNEAKPRGAPAPNWLDTSVEAMEKARADALAKRRQDPTPPAPQRTIFNDEGYRQRLVTTLLERAAAAK